MKNISVRAQFECMVQKDGENIGILENNAQEILIKTNKDFILTFFPLNNFESLPYSCKVFVNGTSISTNTDKGIIIKMPHNCYDIIFSPYQLRYIEPFIEQSQTLNSTSTNVTVQIVKEFKAQQWIQTLQIYEKNNNVFSHKMSSIVQNCKISSAYINNEFFIIISGTVDDYEYAFIISANNKYQSSLELLCHKIEINDKNIKTLTKCFDIAKHGKVSVYEVVNSQITKSDEYIVNLKEGNKVLPQVVPFVFFESLKLGDIKLCRTHLTESLNSSIDDIHLKAYFGNFQEARPSANSLDAYSVVLIYKEKESYFGKLCKIEMKGDKIDNFELLDN